MIYNAGHLFCWLVTVDLFFWDPVRIETGYSNIFIFGAGFMANLSSLSFSTFRMDRRSDKNQTTPIPIRPCRPRYRDCSLLANKKLDVDRSGKTIAGAVDRHCVYD